FVPGVEEWIADVLAHPGAPAPEEFREKLVKPLLDQLKVDAGEAVYQLAKGRLGLDGPPQSVRQQARRMGVTRARVYQLLDDCSKVFDVRWPEGKVQFDALAAKLESEEVPQERVQLFYALRELIYPSKYAEVSDSAYSGSSS